MQEGEVIGGKYELSKLIAMGAMGSVFEAFHVQLKRRIAIKFLRPELCDDKEATIRFLREAQAAAAIGSEHIAAVTDVGQTDDGLPYLVMEYLEGQTLAKAMRASRQFEVSRAASIGIQLCWALAAAHDKGIIHRDIKPDNVLLVPREDGTELVKVLDFGIAKMAATLNADQASITKTGTTLGTPYYMAPEQARAIKDLDGRVDVYSIGVLLYEMLTGRQPFTGINFTAIVVAAYTTVATPPKSIRPDISQALEKVVLKAMAKDREGRYGSARDLADALEPFSEPRPSTTTSPERLSEEVSSSSSIQVAGPPTEIVPKVDIPLTGDHPSPEQPAKRFFLFGFVGILIIAVAVIIIVAILIGGFYLYHRGVEDGANRSTVDAPSQPTITLPEVSPPSIPPEQTTLSGTSPPLGTSVGDASLPAVVDGTPPSEHRPEREVYAEANRHFQKNRFSECANALHGVEHTPRMTQLSLKCLHRAGRTAEACHTAQSCVEQPPCKTFIERRCTQR